MNLQKTIRRILREELLNESKTYQWNVPKIEVYDAENIDRFKKVLNKSMQKYDWWKDIDIETLSYTNQTKKLNIYAVLSVDVDWAAEQWRILYDTRNFNEDEHIILSEIIGGELGYELRNDISDIFEFTFGETVNSLSLNFLL